MRPGSLGGAVVVIESTKMEIPVVTESSRVPSSIAVQPGAVVREHDLVAVVE